MMPARTEAAQAPIVEFHRTYQKDFKKTEGYRSAF
jgi:hypothetical protein